MIVAEQISVLLSLYVLLKQVRYPERQDVGLARPRPRRQQYRRRIRLNGLQLGQIIVRQVEIDSAVVASFYPWFASLTLLRISRSIRLVEILQALHPPRPALVCIVEPSITRDISTISRLSPLVAVRLLVVHFAYRLACRLPLQKFIRAIERS